MIAFESVVVRYRAAARAAVDGVSFAAPAGRVTAIAGPNGSGKSTLVRALLGRVPLAGGRIVVDGRDARQYPSRELAARVAVVTQREEPAFTLAARVYVALGRYPHAPRWGSRASDDGVVDEAMERAQVSELAERRTDELSGGEWQRLRLARALAQQGAALVLDEPTTFLDVAHEMALFELIAELAGGGMAVLVVSHQLNLVARFADSVVLLHDGTVAAAGTPAEVMQGSVLERVYDWPLVVTRDPAVGAPALVPLRVRRPG
jgi:iron complex transport system ATP-binding protein